MSTDPQQTFEFTGKEYDWMLETFHSLIGKLSVVAMHTPPPERAFAKEVHQQLIDFTIAWETLFEEKGDADETIT
jgi:hypothetical protein